MDELLSDFLTETAENLQVVDNEIVRWEQNPTDRALLDNIFRLVHTIKGTCGFLNLPRLEALAHAAETVLGRVRDGTLSVSAVLVTEVLAALDGIKAILRALEANAVEPAGDDAALIARLEAVANGGATPIVLAPQPEREPEAAADSAEGDRERVRPVQTIRVSVDLLEQLMTTVSELVLTRNQLLQIARQQGNDAYSGPLQRLSQCVAELQEGVMRTRMQPISNAWASLPRMVRNLSVELMKKIELEMVGGDTELDRQVLELIKDPLAHMVRNAADHGIEDPEQRVKAGKREAGRIRLHAYQQGGHIILELSDDGRGIDSNRLRAKAIGAGLITASEADQMSVAQLQKLIFHPGLSTAESVTSVSGRGVGMDVVRSNIEKIGGTIEVDSSVGHGTRFTIRIPLTLAIVSALIVAAGGSRFAVPQIAVLELVRATANGEHRIERLHDAPVLRLRDRLLPLVSLSKLLDLPESNGKEQFIVVAQAGSFVFGIVVDDVFDTEEIVVKPVAPILVPLSIYSGNAILGDGQVIMILDINGIATAAAGAARVQEQAEPVAEVEADEAADRDSMLLFRAGSEHPKAVPLSLVARIEDIDVDQIEWSEGRPVVQYRGHLMRLLQVDASCALRAKGRQPVLVFSEAGHSIGLAVDEVIDIVEDEIDIHLSNEGGGRLGTAIVGGRVTEILDVGYYLQLGRQHAINPATLTKQAVRPLSVLVVDDSAFFRNMLRPLLGAAGYTVTTVASAEEALKLREAGDSFDLILSDVEMPGLSGVDFARHVRSGGNWRDTPLIALSALTGDNEIARGGDAGFDDYVPKFDRVTLLSLLEQRLTRTAA